MNRVVKFLPLIALGLILTVMAVALLRPAPATHDPLAGRDLPQLSITPFSTMEGFDPNTIEGPYLLNIWASWCTPCRIEHPYLMVMSDQGIPIYGIVHKDDAVDATQFLRQLGNPFTALMADDEGRVGIEIGFTGAPETLLIDGEGRVQARWRGAITDISWEAQLAEIWSDMGGQTVDWTHDSHTP